MNHLTVDEIIEFVSLKELNMAAIELATTVNGHIRNCEKCLNLVNAFQLINDEFEQLCKEKDFADYVNDVIRTGTNEKAAELQAALEEADNLY